MIVTLQGKGEIPDKTNTPPPQSEFTWDNWRPSRKNGITPRLGVT